MKTAASYDVVVLGAGSAGYAAARTCAAGGAKVAVVDGGAEVGGLCILRGCMPTKALLESAHRLHEIGRAGEFGIKAGKASPDWKAIVSRKDRLIREFAGYRRTQLEKGKFDFIRGYGSFVSPTQLRVSPVKGDRHAPRKEIVIGGKTFILAMGSVVAKREIPGLEEAGYLTSDEAINIRKPLRSLIVLGGGAIACECAQYFAYLGVKVTVVQRSAHLLTNHDADVAAVVKNRFERDGIRVHCGTELVGVRKKGRTKSVRFRQNGKLKTVSADEILYALGRKPATEKAGLEAAGIRLDRGYVKAGLDLRSNQPHIFAAGDVTGPYEVVHTAIQQAEIAGENALLHLAGRNKLRTMDYRLKMEVIFTEPEVASVGLNEREAAEKGIKIKVAKYPFDDHGKSQIMGALDGFVKILANAGSGKILGSQIAGPHASDLIHEMVAVMYYGGTVQQLKVMPHYHPTLAEIVTYPAEEISDLLDRG